MSQYLIACSSANSVEGEAAGRARFTIMEEVGELKLRNPQSVEVKVTFDPETKTWAAEVVKQWEGRF